MRLPAVQTSVSALGPAAGSAAWSAGGIPEPGAGTPHSVPRVGSAAMKLLYKPLAIVSRGIASRLGKSTFRGLWARIDDDDPPATTAGDAGFAKVVGAAVLEAATMAAFAAAADRISARAFYHLFGAWPGQKRKMEESD